jgi:hypothetical protein
MSARTLLEPGCTGGIFCEVEGHVVKTQRGKTTVFSHAPLTLGQRKTMRERNVEARRMREALSASLDFALGPETDLDALEEAKAIVASLHERRDAQPALQAVLATLGPAVFGDVTRFLLEADTVLSGHAESISTSGYLASSGYTVRDLHWPDSVLHAEFIDQAAPEDPAREARLREAIEAWQAS